MKRHLLSIGVLFLAVGFVCAVPLAAESSTKPKPSVTVYPVVITPHRINDDGARRVGIVVATLLERAGLEELEVADAAFAPPDTDEVDAIARAFGKHVGDNPIETDYAVLAQFVGTPQSGVKAIRTIVVDRSGKAVLAESAGAAEFDKAAHRPKDPMSCSLFVAQRLRELWKLEDPLRPGAPQGKMAEFWKKDAGIPEQDELDAMARRAATLEETIKTATCTVYPARVGGQSDAQCAVDLADMLNESGLCRAEASDVDPALQIAGHSNEQKVLWDTARAFRDFVKKNRPSTDYAVFVDYALFGTKVGYVHAIVCDQSGDWVLVDMQNSHHADFERIDPKSSADCNQLLLVRLKSWVDE